jgi:type II secretory pathway component GspD/PulD (secretin)
MTNQTIALPPVVGSTTYTGLGATTGQNTSTPQYIPVNSGPTLEVTPTITKDKKHVILNISTYLQDFLGLDSYLIEQPVAQGQATVLPYTVQTPKTQTSNIMTRVNVPDGGTILLGGVKLTSEEQREAGVPVLSKIPILGRLFDNRSTVKDNAILLILVKPTIILQKEKDSEAISAMEVQAGAI